MRFQKNEGFMQGLILEIQRGALDPKFPLETLLRQMKVAAVKLSLDSLESWVENELNGYSGDLPDYRVVLAAPYGWNAYNGWIPMQSDSSQFMDTLSTANIGQNVSSLEDLLNTSSDGTMMMNMSVELVAYINKLSGLNTAKMVHKVSRGTLVTIVSRVRNLILDWSIKMEKAGITGEGLTFSDAEKLQARETMSTINIENFNGVLGNDNNTGDINANFNIAQASKLIEDIRGYLPNLRNEGVDTQKLVLILNKIDGESKKAKPDRKLVRSLLESVRDVLVGASGGLTAEGAKALLTSFLNGS